MIILRNKNFASGSQLEGSPLMVSKNQTKGILIEIVKIIEFYETDEDDLYHWAIEMVVSKYFNEIIRAKRKLTDAFIILESKQTNNKSAKNRFGNAWIDKIEVSLQKDFIKEVLDKFIPGNPQYQKYSRECGPALNDFVKEYKSSPREKIDFYHDILKYIGLSLSGDINPDHSNYWDNDVIKKSINFDSNFRANISDIEVAKKIFLKCIFNIKGYIAPSLEGLI